jgi:glucose/arabinose dehydrogenase
MNKIFIACIVAGGLLLSHSPLYAATYPNGFTESTVVSGLAQPIALAFAPDGRIFVTEKAGKIRVIKNGQLLSEPFLTIPVTSDQERGLLGITLDPEFEINRHVYVYYTRVNEPIRNRVRRFTASNVNPDVAEAGSELILIDNIPGEHGWHNAGNINFGVDGKLLTSARPRESRWETASNQ